MEPDDILEIIDFLPNLPKPNLDDRSFEDLVEECLLRIPRYCPEWTNYNPGDPGVTLIELFAWLVHQMLYRFNYVPRRHYVAFLELLGLKLEPPKPAHTELTFYFTKAQERPALIQAGTEVATVRTENQDAIIFTTDQDLVVGQPRLKHILLGRDSREAEFPREFSRSLASLNPQDKGDWDSLGRSVALFEPCVSGNAFYLVLDPRDLEAAEGEASSDGTSPQAAPPNTLEGNILALNFKGPRAVTTGIDPNAPPLRWEAWNGKRWIPGILRISSDDRTKGFSFDRLGDTGPNPEQEGADVVLHLPQDWPHATVGNYQGHWLRCVYSLETTNQQYGYQRSPEITGVTVRSIGGAVSASECITIREEVLGESDGRPGQSFQLSSRPVLQRTPEEYIRVRLADGTKENWQERPDFASSREESNHYTIDSVNGTVQFGPLVRESFQLQQQIDERRRLQSWGRPTRSPRESNLIPPSIAAVLDAEDQRSERQYGRVPPLGAEITMVAYRTGGGSQGNVQAGTLTVLKTAIPYVKSVVNYQRATGGVEEESLDDAVMRVPAVLRHRKTALTPEEFQETALVFQPATGPKVHRAECITAPYLTTAGVVHLIVVPTPPQTHDNNGQGLHPSNLGLTPEFTQGLQKHLNLHKALGLRVKLDSPDYVGVQVRAEIFLHPQYAQPQSRPDLNGQLQERLYRFLSPITGGAEETGWPLGRPVRASEIIALLQQAPEVSYVGQVELFSLRHYGQGETAQWVRQPAGEGRIDIGELASVCSWADDGSGLSSSHQLTFTVL